MKIQNSELRQAQIKEAVERMQKIGLQAACVRDFKNSQKVWYSTPMKVLGLLGGALFIPTENAPEKAYIEAAVEALLEVDPQALPYHAAVSKASFGTGDVFQMCNLLYVSSHPEDWGYERPHFGHIEGEPAQVCQLYCWAYNVTDAELSDFGTCTFKPMMGGIIRIG